MLREHDRIILTENLTEEGLQEGDVGVIIHVYRQREAFEVEFWALNGDTIIVDKEMASRARQSPIMM